MKMLISQFCVDPQNSQGKFHRHQEIWSWSTSRRIYPSKLCFSPAETCTVLTQVGQSETVFLTL